ncbi:hypothetical protein BCR44DRAFT_107676, partial [Catenaria anguillulae PL171]
MSAVDKLNMAVVYGRQPLDIQFRIVCAWEAVARAVVDREQVLGEWIRWEYDHGQPMRFWQETSVERLPESRARAELLGKLDRAGERVREAVREMRRVKLRVPEPQYSSVDMPVMYRGQDYLAKMRVDQRKLLHSLANPME